MFKVGDRVSLAILGLCCGGTFIGLTLTSVAKRQGQTGPPEKTDWPWLKDAEASFEQRLGQLNVRGAPARSIPAGSTPAASGGAAARLPPDGSCPPTRASADKASSLLQQRGGNSCQQ